MAGPKWLQLAKRPTVRASASSVLASYTLAPNSGFVFVDNSQGASGALAELAGHLDFALEQIDGEKELRDQLRYQLDRLSKKAAEYSNSNLGPGVGERWTCSSVEAELLSAACACSAVVYDKEAEPSVPGMTVRRSKYVSSSTFGTTKATGFWTVESHNNTASPGPFLVIAVRGTASNVDHMVNLNGKTRDNGSDDFVDLCAEDIPEPLNFHPGFLYSAKALAAVVTNEIEKHTMEGGKIKHVLFTGHSAGGATASILYAHFLSSSVTQFSSIKFSLITFGAAPVATFDITPFLHRRAEQSRMSGLMLAMVNEYDVVSRADEPYVRSLVDLYRAIFGLPPITDSPPRIPESRPLFEIANTSSEPSHNAPVREWELPKQQYHLVGDIILLTKRLYHVEQGRQHVLTQPRLEVVKVSNLEFRKLIFCSVEVHRRSCYLQRIESIRDTVLNGSQQLNNDIVPSIQPPSALKNHGSTSNVVSITVAQSSSDSRQTSTVVEDGGVDD